MCKDALVTMPMKMSPTQPDSDQSFSRVCSNAMNPLLNARILGMCECEE